MSSRMARYHLIILAFSFLSEGFAQSRTRSRSENSRPANSRSSRSVERPPSRRASPSTRSQPQTRPSRSRRSTPRNRPQTAPESRGRSVEPRQNRQVRSSRPTVRRRRPDVRRSQRSFRRRVSSTQWRPGRPVSTWRAPLRARWGQRNFFQITYWSGYRIPRYYVWNPPVFYRPHNVYRNMRRLRTPRHYYRFLANRFPFALYGHWMILPSRTMRQGPVVMYDYPFISENGLLFRASQRDSCHYTLVDKNTGRIEFDYGRGQCLAQINQCRIDRNRYNYDARTFSSRNDYASECYETFQDSQFLSTLNFDTYEGGFGNLPYDYQDERDLRVERDELDLYDDDPLYPPQRY